MTLLVLLIGLALLFDVANGFHDSANSVATVVSTRVLSPAAAVAWAAFFNFIAFLIFKTKVANSIADGVHREYITLGLVGAAVAGAIIWDLITWVAALPTSSSHALVGGLIGAAVVKAGFKAVDLHFVLRVAAFIVISPLIGMVLGALVMTALMALFGRRSPDWIQRHFSKLQLISAGAYSLGHGGNDAQKTMGIIVTALIATHRLAPTAHGKAQVPLWVVLSCHAAMALGTSLGGWRIVRTMGTRITKLTPADGFAAESAGAAALFLATSMGIPVSTTHTIAGGITGTGVVRHLSRIRWPVAKSIVWAWVLTMPGAGVISAGCFGIARLLGAAV
jgi:inorganic phosphate transporter, PiT family